MIKNVYFICKTCGNIITKYMDDKYKEEALNNLECEHCGGKTFEISNEAPKTNIKVKNRVHDNRAIDKEKYMSQEYKDIRANINRIHKDKTGILGEHGRKFIN